MTNPIPATPGWYLRETDGETVVMDPIVAWWPATDAEGEPILFPFVSGGPGTPVILMGAEQFAYWGRTIVYQPMYIPEDATNPKVEP